MDPYSGGVSSGQAAKLDAQCAANNTETCAHAAATANSVGISQQQQHPTPPALPHPIPSAPLLPSPSHALPAWYTGMIPSSTPMWHPIPAPFPPTPYTYPYWPYTYPPPWAPLVLECRYSIVDITLVNTLLWTWSPHPLHPPEDPPLCASPPSIHGEWFLLHCTCSHPHYSLPSPPPSSILNPSLHWAAVSGPSVARQPSPFFSHPPHLGSLFTKLWCLWSPALAFSCITLFALWLPSQPQPLLCHLIYALSPTFPPCSSSLTSNFDMLSGCLSGMCCCPLTLPPPSFLALSPPHLLHSPSPSPHSSLFSLAPPPPSFPRPVTLCHPPPSSPPSLLNQESQQLGIPLPSGWWWHSPHLLPPPPPLTFLLCIPTHLFASLLQPSRLHLCLLPPSPSPSLHCSGSLSGHYLISLVPPSLLLTPPCASFPLSPSLPLPASCLHPPPSPSPPPFFFTSQPP